MDIIETPRLYLDNFVKGDANDYYEICKDPEVAENAGWVPHVSPAHSLQVIEQFIDRYDVWAIRRAEDERLIGSIGMHPRPGLPDWCRAIGYSLGREYWGHGYATEAVKALMHYAFLECALQQIRIMHLPSNIRSRRVIEKAGLIHEGCLRKIYRNGHGEYLDEVQHSIFYDEFIRIYPTCEEDFVYLGIRRRPFARKREVKRFELTRVYDVESNPFLIKRREDFRKFNQ